MKKAVFILFFAVCSINIFAQTGTINTQKHLKVWVYGKDGSVRKGVLTGGSANSLEIYTGNTIEYDNQASSQTFNVTYENIDAGKIKNEGGLLKGLLIGGGIGLAPIVFGQGGAFVAIFSFPLGMITGAIVGATSKKKYNINGDRAAFLKFAAKFLK